MPAISESKQRGAHWHAADRIKVCVGCKQGQPLSAFYGLAYTTRQGNRSMRYTSLCKPCSLAVRKEARDTNLEATRASSQAWRDRNRDRISTYNSKRRQEEGHRADKAKSQRLRKARQRSGQSDDAAIRAIYAEAMALERLIACCPVFGLVELGYKMHVDHRMPLAKGGLHVADNLQILPAGINMRKGAKCPK